MSTNHFFSPALLTLPKEVLENIAFYYICQHLIGPPVPLTNLLLVSKSLYRNLTNAKHLYARVFKYKFSSSAIRRRGFEPSTGEWASQLQTYCKILTSVRRRRRRPVEEQYVDDQVAVTSVCDDIGSGKEEVDEDEEPLVEEMMFTLWLMCLEDDGCNRLQMQISGVYEWVEGYIQTEMYRVVSKGWPIANAANSCAMWILWYLSSKDRLLQEPADTRESIIDKVLPFLTVPFRYPSAFAPANHFRLPFKSSASTSSAYYSFSEPTTTAHGPFPIYLHPRAHYWGLIHYDRRTPLCTPLASDSAKLLYFTRRETMLFTVPHHANIPRNRADHRERVRAELAVVNGVGVEDVTEREVEVAVRNELPVVTREDYDELNEGLLGGVMVDDEETANSGSHAAAATSPTPLSPYKSKGGGTALPCPYDPWDIIRKTIPSLVDPDPSASSSSTTFPFSSTDLDAAESILFGVGLERQGEGKGYIDESTCRSKRWDEDWWRLRLCRSCWADGVGPQSGSGDLGSLANTATEEDEEDGGDQEFDDDDEEEGDGGQSQDHDHDERMERTTLDVIVEEGEEEDEDEDEMDVDHDSESDRAVNNESDTERSSTFLTGYPQKGALYTPGALDGLWMGRMMIPSEPHLRALLLPPQAPEGQVEPFPPQVGDGADAGGPPPAAAPAGADDPNAVNMNLEDVANAIVNATQTEAGHRPSVFTEDTLGLVSVPIYVRLKEYVMYDAGKILPCAGDTEVDGDEEQSLEPQPQSQTLTTQPQLHTQSQSQTQREDDAFDQEKSNAWFPQFSTLNTEGDKLVVSVPAQSLPPRSTLAKNGNRNRNGMEKFEYVAVNSNSNSRGPPGTFHDEETCTGCRTREEALRAVRARNEVEAARYTETDAETETETDVELPAYVASPSTIPPCTGIRDVLITGTTDNRHAEAWRRWAWKGRVRKWDGMIGLIREPVEDPFDGGGGGSGGGKIFFYGTILGGKNFVGTWRLANQDPRMPAYEGAFTLGKKEEE